MLIIPLLIEEGKREKRKYRGLSERIIRQQKSENSAKYKKL